MSFCKECGSSLTDQALFCRECGTTVSLTHVENQSGNFPEGRSSKKNAAKTEIASNSFGGTDNGSGLKHEVDVLTHGRFSLAAAEKESAVSAPAKASSGLIREEGMAVMPVRMGQRQRVLILSIVFLLAALVVGYIAGAYFTSPERLISRFEKALESSDHKAVAQLLSFSNKNLVINEQSIIGFMNYMEQNPGQKEQVISVLKEQAAAAESNSSVAASTTDGFRGDDLSGIVNMEKDGKYLFYNHYILTVDPVYLNVKTNYAGTVLYVNGQQAAVANIPNYETKLGPYIPGLYELEARFKNELIDLKESTGVELLDPNDSYSMYLKLNGQVVRWDTRFSERPDLNGQLYINGKKVEVNPFQNSEFGPVTMDGTMTIAAEADFPWGTLKSAEVPIDNDYIHFDFTVQESFQRMIKDTVIKHAKENLDAFGSGDIGKLTVSTDKYKNMLQDFIYQFKGSGYAYKSNYVGMVIDMGSFDLDHRNGKWYLTLVTKPLIEAATYVEGESPSLFMQEAYSETGLLYDEDEGLWKVDFIHDTWGFQTDNLKEYKEDKPVSF